MKHMVVLLLSMMISAFVWGQTFMDDPNHPDLNHLRQEGQLVSIRIARGEPLKIFVTGREEANLNLKDLKLTVYRLSPGPRQYLMVEQKANYFELPKNQGASELKIKAEIKGQKEIFQFKLH